MCRSLIQLKRYWTKPRQRRIIIRRWLFVGRGRRQTRSLSLLRVRHWISNTELSSQFTGCSNCTTYWTWNMPMKAAMYFTFCSVRFLKYLISWHWQEVRVIWVCSFVTSVERIDVLGCRDWRVLLIFGCILSLLQFNLFWSFSLVWIEYAYFYTLHCDNHCNEILVFFCYILA